MGDQGEAEPAPDAQDDSWQGVHDLLLETSAAVSEHFGDREPTDDELREFLRRRLIGQGRSAEEADDLLRDL